MFDSLKGITLYIRKKPKWINYVNTAQDLRDFIDSCVFKSEIVIGDLALFSKPMKSMLLKLLEDKGNVSLYSSEDISDPVILSRVTFIEKEPVPKDMNGLDIDAYNDSPRDYQSVVQNLSTLPTSSKLVATKLNQRLLNFLISRDGKVN